MKKSRIIIGITLFISSLSCLASDWQYAAGNDKTLFYIDLDSFAQVGPYTKVWVRSDFLDKQDTNSYPVKKYQSSKMLYYFECKGKMLGVSQRVSYENMMSQGEVVESYSKKFDPKMLDDVIPDSIGEGLMAVACGGPAARTKLRATNKASTQALLKQLQQTGAPAPETQGASNAQ